MKKPVALITNALTFAGPAAVDTLLKAGFQVVVHDVAFISSETKANYRSANPDVFVIPDQTPVAIVESAWAVSNRLDVLVSNDAYRPIHGPVEDADIESLQSTLDRLVVFPFGIAKAAIPRLKAQYLKVQFQGFEAGRQLVMEIYVPAPNELTTEMQTIYLPSSVNDRKLRSDDFFIFKSRIHNSPPLGTRQFPRIVDNWEQ